MQLLKRIFGHLEDDAVIVPPFYCDKGTQIYIGRHFLAAELAVHRLKEGGSRAGRARQLHAVEVEAVIEHPSCIVPERCLEMAGKAPPHGQQFLQGKSIIV